MNDTPRPLLRGLALSNTVAVLRALDGAWLRERWAARLTPEQRAALDAGFLPGRWYDEDILARFAAMLHEEVGDEELARFGVEVVRFHVSRTQRFLTRIAGPQRLLARSSGLWSYWRDTGRLEVEHMDATSARVALLDHVMFAWPGYALLYASASAYVVYLSGARQLRLGIDVEGPQRVLALLTWGEAGAAPRALDIDALVARAGAPLVKR